MAAFLRYLASAAATISLALALALSLVALPVHAEVAVTDIEQVSSTRAGRTAFDYTYAILVQNTGEALSEVVATVTSSSPYTVVLDGTVALGDLAAGATKLSEDAFTIRQDRTVPFDPIFLTWNVSGQPANELCGDPAPIVSSLGVGELTSVSAIITWRTDIPATSQVQLRFVATGEEFFSDLSAELTMEHAVFVGGLMPNTLYNVKAISSSCSGLTSTSNGLSIRTRR